MTGTIITAALTVLDNLTKTNDEKEQRKNLNAFKKHRRKLYRIFKKDGWTEQEKAKMEKVDNAYVEALIKLGKF